LVLWVKPDVKPVLIFTLKLLLMELDIIL